MNPLRVALLGYGLADRVIHRPLVEAVPDLVLSHVVTADPERRSQVAQDLPDAQLLALPRSTAARPSSWTSR